MRRLAVASVSSLPSLIIPCPRCAKRMSYRSTSSTKAEPRIQDTVFACDQCGTEVIRTSFRSFDPKQAA